MALGWVRGWVLGMALYAAGCAPLVLPPPSRVEVPLPHTESVVGGRERHHSGDIELALRRTAQKLAQLKSALAQARARQNAVSVRLKDVLRERRQGTVVGAGPGAPLSAPGKGGLAAIEGELIRERSRRVELEEEIKQLRAEEDARAMPPRDAEVVELKKELARERQARLELEAEVARLRKQTGGAPAPEVGFQVQMLERQLAAERERRSEVEGQLARLEAETSNSPFQQQGGAAELKRLREQLAAERAERSRLLGEFRSLQVSGAQGDGAGREDTASPAVRVLRARLIEVESRQQEAMIGLARALAADRKREQELASRLAAAHAGAGGPPRKYLALAKQKGRETRTAAENTRLKNLLEQERIRNSRLAAKLKLADRVTDLIFRMRSNGGSNAAAGGP